MTDYLKQKLYFIAAWYFRFFAQIKLNKWNPRIIAITGSSGKTTLMHFVESQLYEKAKFSHHANSSIGVPFDILGIERTTLKPIEWLRIILSAPFKAFSSFPPENLYVVECDCDRPGEGKFLSEFLKPEATLWISVSRTHTLNFDHLVHQGKFRTVEDAVAYEFGYFLQNTQKCAIINGDSLLMLNQTTRTKAAVVKVFSNDITDYQLSSSGTTFTLQGTNYVFSQLHPPEVGYAILQTRELLNYLQIPMESSFTHLIVPPGRTSLYKGIKNTTLIDSSYNANYSSMSAILNMFGNLESSIKWAVLGDMKELGDEDKEEHEKLAEKISALNLETILLLGPSITKFTYPKLKKLLNNRCKIISCENHRETLMYLQTNIQGGETILFKASQSLIFEGFIEHLLANPDDAKTLPRREKAWIEYRSKRGL